MPKKEYRVKLTEAQRETLQELTGSGTIKVRKYKRARVLLLTDEAHPDGAKTDEEIDTTTPTIRIACFILSPPFFLLPDFSIYFRGNKKLPKFLGSNK